MKVDSGKYMPYYYTKKSPLGQSIRRIMTPSHYAGFVLAVYAAGYLLFTPFLIAAALKVRVPRYQRVQKRARVLAGALGGLVWPVVLVEQLKGMVKRTEKGEI